MSDHHGRAPDTRQPSEPYPAVSGDHLAPRHVMVGDLGVFAGDWAAYDHNGRTRYPTGFVGRLDAQRGRDGQYAVFSCDRSVAEAIIAEQERLRDDTRRRLTAEGLRGPDLDAEVDLVCAPLYFAGDEIIMDERLVHGEADGLSRICPDADGRYTICAWVWEWRSVDPADCDRVAGTPPTPARQPARIPLTHSPLHVPHDRLTVTSLHERLTANGVAFTATLRLDGTPVGTVENEGDGRGTWLRHHDPARFSRHDMHEYVRGCRYRRQPTDEETVLDRLITEHDLTRRIAALPAGTILTRSVDDDGDFCGDLAIVESRTGPDRLDQPAAWTSLANHLATVETSPHSTHWQVWRDGAWQQLPDPTTARPGRR
ncbi:hypothetical protein [Solwaraspora sp. WMMA2065]|uniref:hypothetical protein n=1 Tax=Solwaraspora sp. WMMA2065 TaxID=3015166 RepID=UPI00259B9180|nr:hypothetical protein [Solwaraspora sp. WMMA2065]WJK33152.1 hypothetical protein O7610_20875 [Solwaraspora sp. WMMA2065]